MNAAVDRCESASANAIWLSFLLANLILSLFLWLTLHHSHVSRFAPQEISAIETEIYEKPPLESHLRALEPRAVPIRHAALPVISTKPLAAAEAATHPSEPLPEEHNETQAVPATIVSHGPIPLATPAPRLPQYLRNQDLKTTVVIEFLINDDGSFVPHLLSSSGNEELDALALKEVHEWRFSPAVDNNKAIPSKVRLKINFQVD